MKRILIVEDDRDIAELERDYLELNGFAVDIEADGARGCERALAEDYALLLLDVMLPGKDGMAVCRAVREKKEIPILMVSAKKEDIDKIRGLGMGADDYIEKPFSPGELIARVRAHIARYERLQGKAAAGEITCGRLRLLPGEMRVFRGGEELRLPNREYELLHFLLTHPHRIFSKEELFEELWGMEPVGDISTVAVHIKRLREKIEREPGEQYIETVWGAGYRLRPQNEGRG